MTIEPGKIIQISTSTARNKEFDQEIIFVFALTDLGKVFEYLGACGGAWVELNPLESEFIRKLEDGKLVDL